MRKVARSIWEGVRQAAGGVRASLSLFALWLWLYAALVALSFLMIFPLALFAGLSARRDPALATEPLWRWLEVLVFSGRPYLPLASGALWAALFSWVGGCFLAGGMAGVVARSRAGEGKGMGAVFGEAAVRLFWVSLVGGLLYRLVFFFSLYITFRVSRESVAAGVVVGAPLGLLSLGLALWAALARSVRLRHGVGVFRSLGRAFGEIARHGGQTLGAALFLGGLALLFGTSLALLLYGGLFGGGWWIFIVQQLWVLLRVGFKVSIQATVDR